jgi:protease IV
MNAPSDSSSSHEDPVPPVTASVAAAPSAQPPQIIVRPPSGFGRRLWTWIGWGGFLFCLLALISQWSARQDYYDLTGGIRERFHSGDEQADDKVAIITVRGVIWDGDSFVKQQIDRVREDERVKAVVVRVESPGGTVSGSDFIHHHLTRLREERRIPVVVSMGSVAASGGYYVAMAVGDQEGAIFAEPTTTTGSIGVIVPHYDISGLLKELQIEDDSIASHPRKQLLSMTRPMSEEDREIIEAYVEDSFRRFKEIVKGGRPQLRGAEDSDQLLSPDEERNLATGEIFTASQALAFGLVDEIGFVERALDRAAELAGLDKEQVRFVRYRRPPTLMGVFGTPQADGSGSPVSWLFELSAPRAYYLATTLPPLAASYRR